VTQIRTPGEYFAVQLSGNNYEIRRWFPEGDEGVARVTGDQERIDSLLHELNERRNRV
jgi:hypothetical protein